MVNRAGPQFIRGQPVHSVRTDTLQRDLIGKGAKRSPYVIQTQAPAPRRTSQSSPMPMFCFRPQCAYKADMYRHPHKAGPETAEQLLRRQTVHRPIFHFFEPQSFPPRNTRRTSTYSVSYYSICCNLLQGVDNVFEERKSGYGSAYPDFPADYFFSSFFSKSRPKYLSSSSFILSGISRTTGIT